MSQNHFMGILLGNMLKAYGREVARIRDDRGMEQWSLAAKVGLSAFEMNLVEIGAVVPGWLMRRRIAKALKADPEQRRRLKRAVKMSKVKL